MNQGKLETFFNRQWLHSSLGMRLLLPLATIFGLLCALRRTLYRKGILKAVTLPCPVIVVGNIYLGGTGKTPAVIYLVDALRSAGFHPGVISRGYGGKRDAQTVYCNTPVQLCGDEPLLIAQRTGCPVQVGRKRVNAALALLASNPKVNVIISDDGLQHYALGRQLEIVLFDERGLGNGWLLPAGPLRESAKRQRDFTLINTLTPIIENECTFAMHLRIANVYPLGDSEHIYPISTFLGRRCLAAAGIGNPERFFHALEKLGLTFTSLVLPDHFDFTDSPFENKEAEIILITEKDAVKCASLSAYRNDVRIWVVPVTAHINARFANLIVEKIRGYPPTRHSGLSEL